MRTWQSRASALLAGLTLTVAASPGRAEALPAAGSPVLAAAEGPTSESPAEPAAPTPASESPAEPAVPTEARAAEPAPSAPLSAEVSRSRADEAPPSKHSEGPLAPFRLGVLVGGGLPAVLNLGAQLKVTPYVGVGVNVGIIPTIEISYYGDATVAYQEYDLYAHVYPFGGSFFLGSGLGYAKIKGTLSNDYDIATVCAAVGCAYTGTAAFDSRASVRTLVITPQLGFLHIFDSGFSIGIDVGAQIPVAPSAVDFETAISGVPPQVPQAAVDYARARYITPNDEKVRSTLDKIGRTPLPTFALRLGWFL